MEIRGTLLLALSLMLLPSVTQAQGGMTPADEQSLAAALGAEEQGRVHDAELTLAGLVRKYPSNFQVLASLGEVYANEGEFRKAVPVLEKACQLESSSAIPLANLGAVYLKLSRVEDAERTLKRAVALDPGNPDTQSNLGIVLMQRNHPREAAAAFAAAASSRPSDDDLLYNWGLALYNSSQNEKAVQVLQRVSNAESSAAVQSLLGDICESRKQYQQAVAHYQTAAKLVPSEPNLYVLGIEFMRHWTFDAAIQTFEYGATRYPDSQRTLLALGIAKYANSDYFGAAPILARALDADPDNELIANTLGHDCSLLPDDKPGCSKLIGFAGHHPANAPVAVYAAASILHRPAGQQDLEQAGQLLKQAISADPKFPESYYQQGLLDQQEGNWHASIPPLEQAIVLKPEYAQAHYRLMLAYSHTNQHQQAKAELALWQKYDQQGKDDVNARFRQVTIFLVAQR